MRFARRVDQNFRAFLPRRLQSLQSLGVRFVFRTVCSEKFLVLDDQPFRALHVQIGHLSNQTGIASGW